MGRMFRSLRADEIECRVGRITDKGLSLLLYKDARVDQNVLDETVGPMNWQRKHDRNNANCIVSIWDDSKQQWISKEDTGTESNTEAEKGLASDSFKRACVNWGIGRELYTAPFIWISAGDCEITTGQNGKKVTYDKFKVTEIEYQNDAISYLQITNMKKKKVVYSYGSAYEIVTGKDVDILRSLMTAKQVAQVEERYGKPLDGLSQAECAEVKGVIRKWKEENESKGNSQN